jgi:hypothetical protein
LAADGEIGDEDIYIGPTIELAGDTDSVDLRTRPNPATPPFIT